MTSSVIGSSDSESETAPKNWLQLGNTYSENDYHPPASQPWLDSSSYRPGEYFDDGEASNEPQKVQSSSYEPLYSLKGEMRSYFDGLDMNSRTVEKHMDNAIAESATTGERAIEIAKRKAFSFTKTRFISRNEKLELSAKYKAAKKASKKS